MVLAIWMLAPGRPISSWMAQNKGVDMLNAKQIDFFKTFFNKLINDYERERESKNISLAITQGGDEVDQSTEESEKVLSLKLLGREGLYIKKVKKALLRIEKGVFGECDDCGENIDFLRLKARPTAEKCIGCKEEEERAEGHILYHKKSHTNGKTLKVLQG